METDQVKIKVGYSETVFEEPFKSQVFSIEVEKIIDGENIVVSLKDSQEMIYGYVKQAIEKYAPKWKTFEDLERMQKGLPPIGRKKDVDADYLDD